MKNWLLSILPILCLSLFAIGCGSASTNVGGYELSIYQDSEVTVDGDGKKSVQAGEKLKIEEQSVLIESPGYVGVMLYPVSGENQKTIQVDLKPISKWGGKTIDLELNRRLKNVFHEVFQIQTHMSRREWSSAEQKINRLLTQYPSVATLYFMKSSLFFLQNMNQKALDTLKIGLSYDPEDPDAIALYKKLGGDEKNILTQIEKYEGKREPSSNLPQQTKEEKKESDDAKPE